MYPITAGNDKGKKGIQDRVVLIPTQGTYPTQHHSSHAGRVSLIGCASAWYADGHRFDPHVRQHSFVEIGHEIISTAILSLPLIEEGQLSVTGKRICTKYW